MLHCKRCQATIPHVPPIVHIPGKTPENSVVKAVISTTTKKLTENLVYVPLQALLGLGLGEEGSTHAKTLAFAPWFDWDFQKLEEFT